MKTECEIGLKVGSCTYGGNPVQNNLFLHYIKIIFLSESVAAEKTARFC